MKSKEIAGKGAGKGPLSLSGEARMKISTDFRVGQVLIHCDLGESHKVPANSVRMLYFSVFSDLFSRITSVQDFIQSSSTDRC